MAGYKETPRQRMIGMMYLVLTALLALNVSKDILRAFVTVNDGLLETNSNYSLKIGQQEQDFATAHALNPNKVKVWYDKALEARKLSAEMQQYIKDLLTDVVAYTEFGVRPNYKKNGYKHREHKDWKEAETTKLGDIKKLDSYDKPLVILLPDENRPETGQAQALRLKIEQFEKDMITLLGPEADPEMDLGFNYERGPNADFKRKDMSWEFNTFYHTVLAADVVIFNEMINEVLNAESEILALLMNNISKSDYKFDKVTAVLVPESKFVAAGNSYKAELFVSAYDSKSKINAIVNGSEMVGDSGKVTINFPASGEGERDISGKILLKHPVTGANIHYEFQDKYTVFRPTATVSATKMNVFYRGLQNPISVSVPGVTNSNVSVSISGATYTSQGNGNYLVSPGAGRNATVSISAKIGDRTMPMGSFQYRIFRIPDPVAMVAGKQSGQKINKSQLASAGFVSAVLKDFLFEGVKFKVKSFTFAIQGPSGVWERVPCRGAILSGGAKSKVQSARRGQRVLFEDIKAKGPGGTTRSLPSVVLTIN